MTGRPCGKKAAFASKGYFAKQRNRRGRQEGYVVASTYQEIVIKSFSTKPILWLRNSRQG